MEVRLEGGLLFFPDLVHPGDAPYLSGIIVKWGGQIQPNLPLCAVISHILIYQLAIRLPVIIAIVVPAQFNINLGGHSTS